MKKFAFAVAMVLAMATTASAVTLSVVQGPDPVDGFRSFTVKATGVGINTLGKFTVSGYAVRQTSTNSSWTGNGTAGGPGDSYVMFGTARWCDMGREDTNHMTPITTETILPAPNAGTLNNYDSVHDTWDGYFKVGMAGLDENLTVDLLHLVLQDASDTVVNVELYTVTGPAYATVTKHSLSTSIYSPVDGDTNKDGDVDAADFDAFGKGWFGTAPPSWATGDFNADGVVNSVDFELFGEGWHSGRGPGWIPPGPGGSEGVAPVPEPGTIVMLVLGALCLAAIGVRGR